MLNCLVDIADIGRHGGEISLGNGAPFIAERVLIRSGGREVRRTIRTGDLDGAFPGATEPRQILGVGIWRKRIADFDETGVIGNRAILSDSFTRTLPAHAPSGRALRANHCTGDRDERERASGAS